MTYNWNIKKDRIKDDIALLEKQIVEQQQFIDDPEGAKKHQEESIKARIEGERAPQRPVAGVSRTKFINSPPVAAPIYFQDRSVETNLVGDFLKDDAIRLISIVGRAGIGKTAMVCRLLKSLEGGELPEKGGKLPIDGIVYLNKTRLKLPHLYADLYKLLPDDIAQKLAQIYKNPKASTEDQMRALLEAFPHGRVVVLMDNFEDVVDHENSSIQDTELDYALRSLLNLPHHGVKVILTSRIAPRDILLVQPGRQIRLDLDEGLPSPFAENILREMDADGKVGLKNAPDEMLGEARQRTLGNPRALEALFAILSADRETSLREILDDTEKLLPENVVQALVGEAFNRLDSSAQMVMQMLAIYNSPVTITAVDYLLQPYLPGLDSAPVLNRLANLHFIRKEAGRYYLHQTDREFALSRIPKGEESDRKETDSPPFTQYALLHHAAEYFRQVRLPREEWKTIEDLAPLLAEFDLRCSGRDYDTGAQVMLDIGSDYLLLWGHYRLMVQQHERLRGKINNPNLRRRSVGSLGTAYWSMAEVNKAITCYEQALDIARKVKNRRGEGVDLGNLGLAYSALGQVPKAIEYYEQALVIAREIGAKYNESSSLLYLADALGYQGEIEKAISHYNQALLIANEIGNYKNQNQARSGLAKAYFYIDDLSSAHTNIEFACKYDYPKNNHNVSALSGLIKYQQGEFAEAKLSFTRAATQADEMLSHSEHNYDALDAKGLAFCENRRWLVATRCPIDSG